MTRLVVSLVLIFASLTLGYAYRQRRLSASDGLKNLKALRDRLQFLAFFLFMPLSSMLSLWGLPSPDERLLYFPLLGLAAWSLGGALSLAAGHLLAMPRADIGSLFCCGSFSNIGAVGSLICVLFFGETTIAYVALYRLCEELFYYGLAIPLASRYRGDGASQVLVQGIRISRLLTLIVAALLTGMVLNLAGIERPTFFGDLAALTSILAATLALFSIGLGLTLSRLTNYKVACAIVATVKFLIIPFAITALAFLFGFDRIENGLPLRVVLILASMPVAMNALLPPALLDLNLDLANACWISSTLALAITLPILSLVVLPALTPA